MSRSSIVFTASFALVVVACGDDSSTGTGGSSASSSGTTSATTGGSPTSTSPSSSSASSGSSSDGGGTSDGGGGAGEGGSGGAGGSGGGSTTLLEACEALNEKFVAISEELECPLAAKGECSEPFDCPEEARAYIDCVDEAVGSATDCTCAMDLELFCPTPQCDDAFDAYDACLTG